MGRTQEKCGVSQVGDVSGIMEVERARGWENVLMVRNTPCQTRSVSIDLKAEDSTHVYRTSRRHGEASPLTPR
jgi:hypothetical protein